MSEKPKVRTCLWFDGNGREAAEFYVSLVPGSYVENEPDRAGLLTDLVVEFRLGGTPYQILNGGPHFKPTPAASISVLTADQAETDRLWQALTENGGQDGRCGWVTDRYGVSWQIVPAPAERLFAADDQAAAKRAMDAMMTMNKIDIAAIEAAFAGR